MERIETLTVIIQAVFLSTYHKALVQQDGIVTLYWNRYLLKYITAVMIFAGVDWNLYPSSAKNKLAAPALPSNSVTCTSVPAKWHLILSIGFSRVHEYDWRTDGPRTDSSVALGNNNNGIIIIKLLLLLLLWILI